jgi:hypothetical protein
MKVLYVLLIILARTTFAINFLYELKGLRCKHIVVLGGILESFLNNSIVGQEFNNSERQIRSSCLLICLLCFIETVISTKPVSIW